MALGDGMRLIVIHKRLFVNCRHWNAARYHDFVALTSLDLAIDPSRPIPPRVQAFLADASARVEAFIENTLDDPVAGFVPSDYLMVNRALEAISTVAGGSGGAFCEWGSGLGVIACLAAMVGFDAVGIEIEARLVEASRQLARDHRINAQFVLGSYVPDGHVPDDDTDESHVMTLESGRAAYEELGLDVDDFDCIFAYPWPGEDDVVTEIFRRYAARGAILVTFHGQDGLLVRRKVR
jgi:SAM-dependent methyltransferase